MSGRVCERHNEWCPDGECRWCEPEPAKPRPGGAFGEATARMIAAAQQHIAQHQALYAQQLQQPPPPQGWTGPPAFCGDPCPMAYGVCQLQRGHSGVHQFGSIGWSDVPQSVNLP